jgi:hypothetical protein
MSDLDRGFLTGFFEGEATFAITEQNGGGSYSCSASVRLRDDDQDLLEWLVALTGLGSLHRVPAQGTSRPQIGWKIDSQADCAELIRLIGACGFHGRRAAELALWTQAVDAWTSTAGDDRRERLGSLKARLQASRRFGRGASAARPFAGTTNLTLGYISGLVCAEGCLHVNNLRPRFAMHMRADERPLLDLLRSTTRLGRVYEHTPQRPLHASAKWVIAARDELERLTGHLFRARLPGRKGVELEPWSVSVAEICTSARLGVRPRRVILQRAADRLRASRRYQPTNRDLLRLPRPVIREECLAALRAWSETTDDQLTCGSYTNWRRDHRSSPTRNTVARQFGSWYAAMEAAGLAERAARRRPTVRRGDAKARAGAIDRRAQLIVAVRQFESEHGHVPSATEFFRWRRASCPTAPSQATVYRLFPGGWDAVLRALADTVDAGTTH